MRRDKLTKFDFFSSQFGINFAQFVDSAEWAVVSHDSACKVVITNRVANELTRDLPKDPEFGLVKINIR